MRTFGVRLMRFAPGEWLCTRTLDCCRMSATVILVPNANDAAIQMKSETL